MCGTQQDEPAAKTPKTRAAQQDGPMVLRTPHLPGRGSVVTVAQMLEGVPTYSEPWTSKSERTYHLDPTDEFTAGTVGKCGTVGTVDAS